MPIVSVNSRLDYRQAQILYDTSEYYFCSRAEIVRVLIRNALLNKQIDTSRTGMLLVKNRSQVIKIRVSKHTKDLWYEQLRSLDITSSDYAIRCLIDTSGKITDNNDKIIIKIN
jgi:hypothetical protein